MAEKGKKEKVFKGFPICSGKVVSRVCVFSVRRHKTTSGQTLSSDEQIAGELVRFENARDACSKELDNVADQVRVTIGPTEAEIFSTQKHILNDPEVYNEIKQELYKQRVTIETVILFVFNRFEEKFAVIDNSYIRERSSDLAEISQRLLDYLTNTISKGFACDGQAHCSQGTDRVVVAEELTTDMTIHLNLRRIQGVVTERGGISSHAAIIARSVDIPSVSGIPKIYKEVYCGASILVDGDNGIVVIDPEPETIRRMIPVESVLTERQCLLRSPEGTHVFANVSLIEDVYQAQKVQADGIGLLRTEIAFIQANRALSLDEQHDFYARVQSLMKERPVVFRLLDVGGDKDLPFLNIKKEENPFLGWRGARFLLESPELFSTQVRALARLSLTGKLRILIPMVIDSVQLEKISAAIREIALMEHAVMENILIGAMFEVPSACLQPDKIFSKADFASIGSNDLIQYLFAVDRNNELVSQDYNPDHPVLWDVLKNLSDAAQRARKPLSICGEMAGKNTMVSKLFSIGISSISVTPRLIPRVRSEIAEYLTRHKA